MFIPSEITLCWVRYIKDNVDGNLNGKITLAHLTIDLSYYWPCIQKDVAHYIQTCDQCRRYAP